MAKPVPCYNRGCGQMFEEDKNNEGTKDISSLLIVMPAMCNLFFHLRQHFLQNLVDIIRASHIFMMLTKVGRVARRKVSILPSFSVLKAVH